jgi:hypothetical protein
MEKQNKLAKLAIAGLLLASSLPMNAQATNTMSGTLLAAGCAAHGCGGTPPKKATSKESGDATDDKDARRVDTQDSDKSWNRNSSYDKSAEPNSRDSNEPASSPYSRANSPSNNPYSSAISENEAAATTTTKPGTYNTPEHAFESQKPKLTKLELVKQLSPQGKAIFSSLDADGQDLALTLASQDSYKDKDLAVKEAQRRINEQRGMKAK